MLGATIITLFSNKPRSTPGPAYLEMHFSLTYIPASLPTAVPSAKWDVGLWAGKAGPSKANGYCWMWVSHSYCLHCLCSFTPQSCGVPPLSSERHCLQPYSAGRALLWGQLMPAKQKWFFFPSCQPRLCHWKRCSCSSVWLSCTSKVLPECCHQLGCKFFSMLPASTALLMKFSSIDLVKSLWHSALSPSFCTSWALLKT